MLSANNPLFSLSVHLTLLVWEALFFPKEKKKKKNLKHKPLLGVYKRLQIAGKWITQSDRIK